MLICRNAEGVNGQRKVGNPCPAINKEQATYRNYVSSTAQVYCF